MNRLFYLLLMFLISSLLHACAQTKNVVVNSSGHFYMPMRGTLPVNENGQPINSKQDTVFILFVETKENKIQWNKAWKGGTLFLVNSTQIKEAKAVVGETTPDNKKIILSPAKGNTLWQIELTGSPIYEKAPQSITHQEILLKGIRKKQVFYHRISILTELASPLYQ